jgi:hypothetical protein
MGHLFSQIPHPMHNSVTTTGTRTCAPPFPACSRKTIAFFGVGQCSSQTMHGVPWAKGMHRDGSTNANPMTVLRFSPGSNFRIADVGHTWPQRVHRYSQ